MCMRVGQHCEQTHNIVVYEGISRNAPFSVYVQTHPSAAAPSISKGKRYNDTKLQLTHHHHMNSYIDLF